MGARRPRLRETPVYAGATGREDMKRKDPMFAVLKTGGKQYKVQAGDILRVE